MRLFIEIAFKNFYKFLSQKKYFNFYILLLKYGGKKRHKKELVKFYDFKLFVADHLSFIFQFKEIFLEESYKFKSTNNAPVIIDCGSNIGMSILYFKSLYPLSKITAIEADPEIGNILESNLKLNNIGDVNVIKKAAWINADGVSFETDGADGGKINPNSESKIESVDFNSFLNDFSEIDFLKIDIEGAEKILVPHCIENLKKAKNIFIEYHTSFLEVQNLGEILDSFTQNGYRYYIKNENKRISPFYNKAETKQFDLQLNIFIYK